MKRLARFAAVFVKAAFMAVGLWILLLVVGSVVATITLPLAEAFGREQLIFFAAVFAAALLVGWFVRRVFRRPEFYPAVGLLALISVAHQQSLIGAAVAVAGLLLGDYIANSMQDAGTASPGQ